VRLFLILLVVLGATRSYAATFDEFLKLAGDEFGASASGSFLRGVVWEEKPEKAYFQCRDRLDNVSLELWQQDGGWVSTRGAPPQPLLFGRNGSIRVFSVFNKKNEPFLAAYFMLDSGEAHVFRVKDWEARLSSIVWQCTEAPWRAPAAG